MCTVSPSLVSTCVLCNWGWIIHRCSFFSFVENPENHNMKNESPFQATEQQLRYIPVRRHPRCRRPAHMMEPKVPSADSFTNPRWLPLVCQNSINELWALVIHRSKVIYTKGCINETALSLVKKVMG